MTSEDQTLDSYTDGRSSAFDRDSIARQLFELKSPTQKILSRDNSFVIDSENGENCFKFKSSGKKLVIN